MLIPCQAQLREGVTTIPQGSTFEVKPLIWKCQLTTYVVKEIV